MTVITVVETKYGSKTMTDKHVIGAYYTDQGTPFRFFVQSDYEEEYAKELAYNLKYLVKVTEKGSFLAELLNATLDDSYHPRLLPTIPETTHTIHLVNIDEGNVELWSPDGFTKKVSFSIEKFVQRYYPN